MAQWHIFKSFLIFVYNYFVTTKRWDKFCMKEVKMSSLNLILKVLTIIYIVVKIYEELN